MKTSEQRTAVGRKSLDELSDSVKQLDADAVGGVLEKDSRSINYTTGDCAGAPGAC